MIKENYENKKKEEFQINDLKSVIASKVTKFNLSKTMFLEIGVY